MTDTSDREPVEGAEILKLLREIASQTAQNGAQLTALGRAVSDIRGTLDQLEGIGDRVRAISATVDRAAPLLDSAPARAMAGGGVLAMLRGNPRRHG